MVTIFSKKAFPLISVPKTRIGSLSSTRGSRRLAITQIQRCIGGPSQIDVVVMLIESSYYRQVIDSRTRRRVQSGKTLQKLAWGARLRPPKCRTTYSVRRAYRMWHGIPIAYEGARRLRVSSWQPRGADGVQGNFLDGV